MTLIQAGPCRVIQPKGLARDGCSAVPTGYGEIREKMVNRPARSDIAKSGDMLADFFTKLLGLLGTPKNRLLPRLAKPAGLDNSSPALSFSW